MQSTIKSLRQQGYKVRVIHVRQYTSKYKFSGPVLELSARGGSTTIEITTPDKQRSAFGESVCSNKDSRKVGNAIALGRALEKLEDK
jgi:hypothetical protein